MAIVGQIIDDKYEILKLIGQGGMSRVYLAMDKRLNKQWAIKEIKKETFYSWFCFRTNDFHLSFYCIFKTTFYF